MSKEALEKEIKTLCESIAQADLDKQAALLLHKMGKVYNQLLIYNYLNQQQQKPQEPVVEETIKSNGFEPQAKEEQVKTEVLSQHAATEQTPPKPEPVAEEKKEESLPPFEAKEKPLEEDPRPEPRSVIEHLASKQAIKIGLNDKFAFIQDLFDGNAVAFKEVVDKINSFESIEEAKSFFTNEVSPNYDWDEELEPTVERFINIIERKV